MSIPQTHLGLDSFRSAPSQPLAIGDRVEGLYPRSQNWLAQWQRDALCDIARRYVKVGRGRSDEPIEGSMSCARCPYRCCEWPATEELIAEWRAWAYAKADEWEKAAAEHERYGELRWHLREHGVVMVGPALGRVGIILG